MADGNPTLLDAKFIFMVFWLVISSNLQTSKENDTQPKIGEVLRPGTQVSAGTFYLHSVKNEK